MASNAQAVLAGLEWYMRQDKLDSRRVRAVDVAAIARLGATDLAVRLDVVLEDDDVSARVVLWDGPTVDAAQAELSACAFAAGLAQAYPGESPSRIAVWQARRGQAFEVAYGTALKRSDQVAALLATRGP